MTTNKITMDIATVFEKLAETIKRWARVDVLRVFGVKRVPESSEFQAEYEDVGFTFQIEGWVRALKLDVEADNVMLWVKPECGPNQDTYIFPYKMPEQYYWDLARFLKKKAKEPSYVEIFYYPKTELEEAMRMFGNFLCESASNRNKDL